MYTQTEKLLSSLEPGYVYRREDLLDVTKSVDRALRQLVSEGKVKKIKPSFYFLPKDSRWGSVPASLDDLVTAFLKSTDYLLITNSDYNSLGLGLTQLWNEVRVYNKKRHEKIKLENFNCSFQRPNNGYPDKITKEFLLVDLVNNANNLNEDKDQLKQKIINKLNDFDKTKLKKLSDIYGKVGTKKYFNKVLGY